LDAWQSVAPVHAIAASLATFALDAWQSVATGLTAFTTLAIVQRQAQPPAIIDRSRCNANAVQPIPATIARHSVRTITPSRSRFALDGADAFQRLHHHPKHFLDRGGQLDARGDQSTRWHDITRH
jgi:hypothetical protein